jgi:hypothetical protein
MEYLRQIEEDVKNLGNEAKKRHPEIKDASDRAVIALRIIRDKYVSEMVKKGNDEKSEKSPHFTESSDLVSPYILACNYADGSNKLISMALNGIQMLLNFGIVPPGDVKNVLRVLSIQVASTKFDSQLKILQILLQMANLLSENTSSTQYFTESTICSFLQLSLQLCDSKSNISTTAAALGAARQLISLIMDGTLKLFINKTDSETDNTNTNSISNEQTRTLDTVVNITIEQASASYVLSAVMLVREFSLFIQSQPGEWLRGVTVPVAFALDVMYELLSGWKFLFTRVQSFKSLLHSCIFPALKPLLKNLQEDFIMMTVKHGLTTASSLSTRIVRIARYILLNLYCVDLFGDMELALTLLVHALQPNRNGNSANDFTSNNNNKTNNNSSGMSNTSGNNENNNELFSFRSRLDEAGAALISRFAPLSLTTTITNSNNNNYNSSNNNNNNNTSKQSSSFTSNHLNFSNLSNIQGFYITLTSNINKQHTGILSTMGSSILHSMAQANANCQIPAHPTAACLEALLSFLLNNHAMHFLMSSKKGLALLEMVLINTICAVSFLFQAIIEIDLNARFFFFLKLL